ncbi:MAG: hypothetical protein ABJH96_19465 [Algoriphagus sp.]|uniref:hypothetical protein n=1 Tax=Algoriphagus sp. TaxID=1872435 RepID=UPI003298F4F4
MTLTNVRLGVLFHPQNGLHIYLSLNAPCFDQKDGKTVESLQSEETAAIGD